MARKVQIEITSPVQDPVSGEVIHQPGTRFDEGAKELEGLPAHMLRPVFTEDDKAEPKAEPAATSKTSPTGKHT